jgi:phage shock protein A
MTDLLKKLGTLIQARVNEVIPEALNPVTPARRRESPALDGAIDLKALDRELAALRQRVNEAIDYETTLNARVTVLETEIARWDAQSNAAVMRGDDTAARDALAQHARANERLAMAQSDLNAHQLVTQDLIRRVNLLDAAIADKRMAQTAHPPASNAADVSTPSSAVPDAAGSPRPAAPTPSTPPNADDDLERRRQRLSKS